MTDQPDQPAGDVPSEDVGPLGDIGAGLALLAISVVAGWSVLSNPALVSTDYGADPGPGMMPQIALVLLALGAVALVVRGVLPVLRQGSAAALRRARAAHWRIGVPTLMVAALFGYALLFPVAGFVWTTLGFAVLWTVLLGILEFRPAGDPRAYAVYLFEAALITFLVWLAFAKLIRIPLP